MFSGRVAQVVEQSKNGILFINGDVSRIGIAAAALKAEGSEMGV